LVPTNQEPWFKYAGTDFDAAKRSGILEQAMAPRQTSGRYQIVNGEVVFI